MGQSNSMARCVQKHNFIHSIKFKYCQSQTGIWVTGFDLILILSTHHNPLDSIFENNQKHDNSFSHSRQHSLIMASTNPPNPLEISYFPRFDRYSLPALSPTNPHPYPVIDCQLAYRETGQRHFPVMRQGLSRDALKRYYDPYPDPSVIMQEYYQQCLEFKKQYDQREGDLYYGTGAQALDDDGITPQMPSSPHSDPVDDPYKLNKPLLPLSSCFVLPTAAQLTTIAPTSQSDDNPPTNVQQQPDLPHSVGIWDLRTTPLQFQPFPSAIEAEAMAKRRGLVYK